MYGIDIDDCVGRVARDRDVLVIVGAQKVPGEVYHLSDLNIAVGNQPHSEVAALAIFLDRVFEGKALKKTFEGAKSQVVPQERGKAVARGNCLSSVRCKRGYTYHGQ